MAFADEMGNGSYSIRKNDICPDSALKYLAANFYLEWAASGEA